MARVFISYSKKDKARLKPLEKALAAQGHLVWWDDQLRSGDNFQAIIEKNLSNAEAVVVVWTPNSVQSKWVLAEAQAAADRGKLLNVRYEPFSSDLLPDFAREMHIESLMQWDEKDLCEPAILKLNEAIGERKSVADRARLRKTIGPTITHIDERLGLSRVLFDFGLPGGLRVYRLLAGSVAMTALVWGLLYFAQMFDDDSKGLEWTGILLVFGFVLLVRSLHQLRRAIVAGDLERYIDRFFESDFAYCTAISAMTGAIIAFARVIMGGEPSAFYVIDDGVEWAGMTLLTITVFRLVWAVWIALGRRIE